MNRDTNRDTDRDTNRDARGNGCHRGDRRDRGAGSLLVLALGALGGAVALLLAALSVSLTAGSTADAAADLAALAAASAFPTAGAPDCARAGAVAAAQHARLVACTPAADGSVVVAVRVAVAPAAWLPGVLPAWVAGRARAGPAGVVGPVGAVGAVGAVGKGSGSLGQQDVQ